MICEPLHKKRNNLQNEKTLKDGEILITLNNITKTYSTKAGTFNALEDIDLQINRGELIAIVGKSGSGKSTLLNIISGIDRPTKGNVIIDGVRVDSLDEGTLARWRGRNIGVVFQFFQLLPTLTVIENILLPMDFCDTFPKKERKARALSLLEKVGIPEQADKLPSALSGGQQQRAAIARALANDPSIIIADEPTGNLDSQTAESILGFFVQLAAGGKTVIVVTHDKEFSRYFGNAIMISDGRIVSSTGDINQ